MCPIVFINLTTLWRNIACIYTAAKIVNIYYSDLLIIPATCTSFKRSLGNKITPIGYDYKYVPFSLPAFSVRAHPMKTATLYHTKTTIIYCLSSRPSATGLQYPQCSPYIHCVRPVSYRNAAVIGKNIEK